MAASRRQSCHLDHRIDRLGRNGCHCSVFGEATDRLGNHLALRFQGLLAQGYQSVFELVQIQYPADQQSQCDQIEGDNFARQWRTVAK